MIPTQKPTEYVKPKPLTYWPYCEKCEQPFFFEPDEPFAFCNCGTTEWGDPRPARYVKSPFVSSTHAYGHMHELRHTKTGEIVQSNFHQGPPLQTPDANSFGFEWMKGFEWVITPLFKDREIIDLVALEQKFEAWWETQGQLFRAGGGDYEKTFAYRAFQYAARKLTKPNKLSQLDIGEIALKEVAEKIIKGDSVTPADWIRFGEKLIEHRDEQWVRENT